MEQTNILLTNPMNTHKTIASFFGIGYIGKGSGTAAAVAASVLWYFSGMGNNWIYALFITLSITAIGIWSSGKMESLWGHDSSRVVIDEVAGMLISLMWVPVNWLYTCIALILFRFFDILKPLLIRKMEQLKGGWGVMMDDVLAGIYANLVVQVILFFHWF